MNREEKVFFVSILIVCLFAVVVIGIFIAKAVIQPASESDVGSSYRVWEDLPTYRGTLIRVVDDEMGVVCYIIIEDVFCLPHVSMEESR